MNPYEILGVSPNASVSQIKDVYRELVKKFHPDRNPSPNAHEMIAQINAAYDILSDSEKRAAFDNRGHWYHETVIEEEDPREVYRREYLKRKKEKAIQQKEANEAALKAMYKVSWWIAVPAFLFCMFVLFDYYLPTVNYDETPKYGTQERGAAPSRYSQKELISLMITEHFKVAVPHRVHLNYDYYADHLEILHIEATRMLKIPRHVSLNLNDQHVYFEVDYTIYTGGLTPFVYIVVVLAVIMLLIMKANPMISEMLSVVINIMTAYVIVAYFI